MEKFIRFACLGIAVHAISLTGDDTPPKNTGPRVHLTGRAGVETSKSTSGAVFTRDRAAEQMKAPPFTARMGTYTITESEVIPKMGESWTAPNRVTWGDAAYCTRSQYTTSTKKKGIMPTLHKNRVWVTWRPKEASEYCKALGAELPTMEDFADLREFLGVAQDNRPKGEAGPSEGPMAYSSYKPELLPTMAWNQDNVAVQASKFFEDPHAICFWTSTTFPGSNQRKETRYVLFNPKLGDFKTMFEAPPCGVRCIIRRKI